MKRRSRGFTLAELLVVVAIIGILVGVAIPTLNAQLNKAKTAVDDANVRSAIGAAMTDYLVNGRFEKGYYPVYIENATLTLGSFVPTTSTPYDTPAPGYNKAEISQNGKTYKPETMGLAICVNTIAATASKPQEGFFAVWVPSTAS